MIKRWRERAVKYHAGVAADAEKKRKQMEDIEKKQAENKIDAFMDLSEWNHATEITDSLYEHQIHSSTCGHHNTKPMLLDAFVAPVTEESPSTKNYVRLLLEARQERDSALLIAREYRDLAETVSAKKREIKYEMEKTVEVVRGF